MGAFLARTHKSGSFFAIELNNPDTSPSKGILKPA